MDISLITIVVQLIFLEGVLSLDNAAVLGAMVAPLPRDQPVPWPSPLRWLGRSLDRFLGAQRDAALKVGLLGAYLGRGLMLALASIVIRNPWLRLTGALYLLYLAFNHLAELGHEHIEQEGGHRTLTAQSGFWSVVVAVELADLAFSLDNVVAAVALSDNYWIVLLGVAIGIVTMRFAAGLFTRLIGWEPALQHAAYLLILAIGVELLLDDIWHIHTPELLQFSITILILLLTVAFARLPFLQPVNVIWPPLLRLCAFLQVPLRWLTWPVRALLRLLSNRRSGTVPSGD